MFRLALDLGKTIQEIERETSSSELIEWVAYYELLQERSEKNG
jgi:hypothetical protein